ESHAHSRDLARCRRPAAFPCHRPALLAAAAGAPGHRPLRPGRLRHGDPELPRRRALGPRPCCPGRGGALRRPAARTRRGAGAHRLGCAAAAAGAGARPARTGDPGDGGGRKPRRPAWPRAARLSPPALGAQHRRRALPAGRRGRGPGKRL
ncbi:MAG: hypothetical protein AVDCRST_MAG27-1550, partial [uncultured Craurococcus sp.]